MSHELALLGGAKAVSIPHPHYQWGELRPEQRRELIDYIDSHKPLSIDGQTGIYAELEGRFADYHGVRFALLTNSGTTALHSAFFGINLSPGDEVIAPAYTFLATVSPLLHCGAVPVLCECSAENGNIRAECIEGLITSKTKAIVVNHQWGLPVEIECIASTARKHGLYLIEDCSHALGATVNGRKVGTFGDAACISLQGNKLVYAGEGGVLLTDRQDLFERAVLLGHYQKRTNTVQLEGNRDLRETGFGLKYRIHPLGAVIANSVMKDVDRLISMRRSTLAKFEAALSVVPGISPPTTPPHLTRGAYYGFKPTFSSDVYRCSRETYVAALAAEGVEVGIPHSKPLNWYPLFQGDYLNLAVSNLRRYRRGDFPAAEKYYRSIVSLPTFTFDADDVIAQYQSAFLKVFTHRDSLTEYEVRSTVEMQ